MDPIVALNLAFSSSWKYIGASCVRPDRGIALGGSGLGFNCHFRGRMKMGLSSSKLWPDLSKPEGAHHQAQSCHKTLLGQPGLCCRFRGLGQWGGGGSLSGRDALVTALLPPFVIHFVTTLRVQCHLQSCPLASASPGAPQRCGCALTPWGETPLVCRGLCVTSSQSRRLCVTPQGG